MGRIGSRQHRGASRAHLVRQDQGLAGGPPARDAFALWALDRDRERGLPPRSGPPLSATFRDEEDSAGYLRLGWGDFEALGGRVIRVELVPEKSTTALIRKAETGAAAPQ